MGSPRAQKELTSVLTPIGIQEINRFHIVKRLSSW